MTQAILLGILAFAANHDYALGTSLIKNAIVTGPIVGLIMGDLTTGIISGGAIELIFIGAQSVGAFIPPNVIVGGILGTAFGISTGQGPTVAVTLAYPIAMLGAVIENLLMVLIRPVMATWADNYASKGNYKRVEQVHIGAGFLLSLSLGVVVSISYLLGASYMSAFVEAIPEVIIDGLTIATGLLPAMGFAMLVQMTLSKKSAPFLFLGFLLASYLEMPVLGIALIGAVIVVIMMIFNSDKQGYQMKGAEDDEF